ncbi:molybdate ABC transporter permease subunit [Hydrogenobacter hydrogenophilus]|uniref:Molybdenum transport system permease n=1 Tax=Hydrogenobacter hydrogenophilus TaxID=35835 RepID=A0A285NVR5_9AQUI|nr:molybdate ABC transporter permease subunit [Hydrogenobacter hydrogenophilus]SNZ13328.1 molybdate transport system permease protein [Hydrogenobacter hydrogenophilus]
MSEFIVPLWLTLKLSFWTTLILLVIGIPLSYYLAYTKHRVNTLLEAVISLPLVLPPTVLGFYLLLLFNKKGFLGYLWYKLFGKQLVFHFEGIVLASIIYSMPMMIHPLTAGFRSVPKNLIEASWTLGKSKLETLLRVILPNMKASILTGLVLSFAHTVGEFGVVLMVGGSVEGETKVVSIAIYDAVEKIDYSTAHLYAFILLSFSLLALLSLYILNRRWSIS